MGGAVLFCVLALAASAIGDDGAGNLEGAHDYFSAVEAQDEHFDTKAQDLAEARKVAEKEAHVVAMEEDSQAPTAPKKAAAPAPKKKVVEKKKAPKKAKKAAKPPAKKASKKGPAKAKKKKTKLKLKLSKMDDGAKVFENGADKEYNKVMDVFNRGQLKKAAPKKAPKKGEEDLGDTDQTGWGASFGAASQTTMLSFSGGMERSEL